MNVFRELARKKQRLPESECIEILKQQLRGVLSVMGDDGYPYGVPINHFYNEEDGCLYFHGGRSGHKIDALKRCDKASFCVYDQGYREEGDWALHIKSVIVFGRVRFVDDSEVVEDICRKLCHRFTDDEGYIEKEIHDSLDHTLLFVLRPEHITGKIVKES